jgi:hypothetical protein
VDEFFGAHCAAPCMYVLAGPLFITGPYVGQSAPRNCHRSSNCPYSSRRRMIISAAVGHSHTFPHTNPLLLQVYDGSSSPETWGHDPESTRTLFRPWGYDLPSAMSSAPHGSNFRDSVLSARRRCSSSELLELTDRRA